MGFKVFSALRQEEKGGAFVRVFEKKVGDQQLWVVGHFPESSHMADEVLRVIRDIAVSKILDDHIGDEQDMFESVLKVVNEKLSEMLSEEEAESILRNGSMLISFLSGDLLLLSNYGQGEVFLLRESALLEVSEGISPVMTGTDFFQNVSSGDLQNGDRIVISTVRLQRFVTERHLSRILSDGGVTESLESISSCIDPQEGYGLLVMNIKTADPLPFPEERSMNDRTSISPGRRTSPVTQFSEIANRFSEDVLQRAKALPSSLLLLGGAVILALLLLFLFFSLLSKEQDTRQSSEFSEFVKNVEQDFSNVDTRVIEGKTDQANLLLDAIEQNARKMLEQRVDLANAEKILTHVQEQRESVNHIMRITNPEVFSDLRPLKSDISTKGISFLKNEFLVYDKNSLYRILASTTHPENVGVLSASDKVQFLTALSSKDELVFVTENGSVFEWQNGQVISADTADKTWKTASDIGVFSKFLYFLSPSDNQIWKYERRESGFTIPEGWITDETVNISDAISFAIDGSVFVLLKDGTIQKYHRGESQPYEVKGTPGGALLGSKIFTNDTLASLFVLDPKEKRIFIYEKYENEAVYKKQIVIENTEPIVDFYVVGNTIYLLGQQQIYSVTIPE
ncbi:hypothetical protein IPN35_01380 [Candidatus Peregrinibacteria bacterium]|nr:MAG: hypothetical protein IPN35_01380 [Candidatus Peregrinibacteria bacterium]